MAPRLIRLPGDAEARPCRRVAPSIDSGMAAATSSPARRLPSIANRTTITSSAALDQVLGRRCAACSRRGRCGRRRCPCARRRAARRGPPASGVDRVHDVERVRAAEHLRHEVDGLAAAICGRCADARQRTLADLGDVGDAHGPRRPARRSRTTACAEVGSRRGAAPTPRKSACVPRRPARSRRALPVARSSARRRSSERQPRCASRTRIGHRLRACAADRPRCSPRPRPARRAASGATRNCASSSSSAGVRAAS